MKSIILNFPKQLEEGFSAAKNTGKEFRDQKIGSILICGMGGSALPGELLKILISPSKIKIPVLIHRDYTLPSSIDDNGLLVFISYSGNTEETLSAFKIASEKKLNMAAITSGGELEKKCKENNVPVAIVAKGIAPRMALGYQFSALLKILENAGVITDIEKYVLEGAAELSQEALEKEGKILSEKIGNKIPLIYSPRAYAPLAYIFKILLNENSKIPAFLNYFPEMCHNEIQAFNLPDDRFTVLILKAEDEHKYGRIGKVVDASADIINSRNFPLNFVIVRREGKNIFKDILGSIVLFYWTTFYLAEKKGIDPLENKLIDEFKKKLKEP
ncbi:MAG: bifunctional phosphoglucose/phosphomannose isomerase [Parcubacteria group bacterium]